MPQITDLTNTTWYFNSQINSFPNNGSFLINFSSYNFSKNYVRISTFTKQEWSTTEVALAYFYQQNGSLCDFAFRYQPTPQEWYENEWRYINITGGQHAQSTALINWLYDNATLIEDVSNGHYLDDLGVRYLVNNIKILADSRYARQISASTTKAGLMSTADKTKLDSIATSATRNTFSSFTGSPTSNQTPAFGGTFTLPQVKQSTAGAISTTARTVTIPNTLASTAAAGLAPTLSGDPANFLNGEGSFTNVPCIRQNYENTDLNNCIGYPGSCTFYTYGPGCANTPDGWDGGGSLLVLSSETDYIYQISFYNSQNIGTLIHARRMRADNQTWQDWILISQYADTFLRRRTISELSLTDVNDIPTLSSLYVSSSNEANSLSNLPASITGHVITLGGASQRDWQFYLQAGNDDNLRIYCRKQHGGTFYPSASTTNFNGWYKVFDSRPNYKTVSLTSTRATLISGGYYILGNTAHVQLAINIITSRGANSSFTYGSGLPAPKIANIALSAYSPTAKGLNAAVASNGSLILSNVSSVAVNTTVTFSGEYLIS